MLKIHLLVSSSAVECNPFIFIFRLFLMIELIYGLIYQK